VPTEIPVHDRTVPVSCHPHERSSSATSARSVDNTGVRRCTTTTEEGRGAVRGTKESHRSSSPAPAQVEVRPRAVLPGGHCPEHQATGPVPEWADHSTDTCHSLGAGKNDTPRSRARLSAQNTRKGADFFNTHSPYHSMNALLTTTEVEFRKRRWIAGIPACGNLCPAWGKRISNTRDYPG
jgi:hypothetical protein